MESDSMLHEQLSSDINIQELTGYKHPTGFNLFLYSRNQSNFAFFLLFKGIESPAFSHCHGSVTNRDPNIFFAIAKEFVALTRGLFHAHNFKFFQLENKKPFLLKNIWIEEDLRGPVIPQKRYTHGIESICRLLCNCELIFQDQTDTLSYFIEIPFLNLDTMKEVIKVKGLRFDLQYFMLNDILEPQNNLVHENLSRCFANSKLLSYVNKFILNHEPVEIRKRFAVISCDPGAQCSMLPSLHYSIYKKHGEHWRFYKSYEGDFPTDEELENIHGVLIPGSGYNAYDTKTPYYKETVDCINRIVNKHKHINFLGVCYGAQIAAQALGGKTERMSKPFLRGGDLLIIEPSFYELEYIKDLGIDKSKPLVIAQAHGDHVAQLPSGAVLHASSKTTNTEVFSIGNNVLAFQGHPEFNEAWTAGSNYKWTRPNVNDYEKYTEEYVKKTFPIPVAREEILKICYTFLKKEPKIDSN